jgi:hypothetical protein
MIGDLLFWLSLAAGVLLAPGESQNHNPVVPDKETQETIDRAARTWPERDPDYPITAPELKPLLALARKDGKALTQGVAMGYRIEALRASRTGRQAMTGRGSDATVTTPFASLRDVPPERNASSAGASPHLAPNAPS